MSSFSIKLAASAAWSVVALDVTACTFAPSGDADDSLQVDGALDSWAATDAVATSDAPPCVFWTGPNVDPCDSRLGVPARFELEAGLFRYDTDTGTLSSLVNQLPTPPGALIPQADGSLVRVVNVTSWRIASSSTLVVSGMYPLVVVAHGDANIEGTIDVSARVDSSGSESYAGPGGNVTRYCGQGAGGDGASTTTGSGGGGGGGGGGSYGAAGGDGGNGHGTGHGGGGAKGAASGNATIEPVRGGCPGGSGGDDGIAAIDEAGRAGDGGGAFELTARGILVVAGVISANGSGGGAASMARAGGGAGGSGGAILLDADDASILASAALCANGGGGGEGGQLAVASQPGGAGTCFETARAIGGSIEPNGGDGGDGGAASAPTGEDATNGATSAGGGGGGGSVGRIRVHGRTREGIDTLATVTPPAS